jgi:hypothetical protein
LINKPSKIGALVVGKLVNLDDLEADYSKSQKRSVKKKEE